jgi:hypothetical protein
MEAWPGDERLPGSRRRTVKDPQRRAEMELASGRQDARVEVGGS